MLSRAEKAIHELDRTFYPLAEQLEDDRTRVTQARQAPQIEALEAKDEAQKTCIVSST